MCAVAMGIPTIFRKPAILVLKWLLRHFCCLFFLQNHVLKMSNIGDIKNIKCLLHSVIQIYMKYPKYNCVQVKEHNKIKIKMCKINKKHHHSAKTFRFSKDWHSKKQCLSSEGLFLLPIIIIIYIYIEVLSTQFIPSLIFPYFFFSNAL